MIKLSIDAMGGDFAPEMIVKGAIKALKKEKSLNIILYGDKDKINNIINKDISIKLHDQINQRISIIHTPKFLNMDVCNIREELRDNPSCSMFLALQAAKDNEVDGVVSAGPTQALILSSYLIIGTLKNFERIALAPIFSSLNNEKKKIILDAGANISLKPKQILNFAIYSSVIMKEIFKISKPIVKLLNIGSEKNKGREFEKETFELLSKEKNIYFKGNEEPNNILNSEADILISDGFTTNMILKSYEGAIETLLYYFKKIMTENYFKKIVSKILFKKKIQEIKKKIDNKELGGAILLGLKKIVIKAHGNSEYYSFYKAIIQAKNLVEKKFFDKINKNLK